MLKIYCFKKHLGVNINIIILLIFIMEFGISVSPAQMRKLKSGGAITMKSMNFVDDAPNRLRVMPNTARRIQTAMKKDKGVRIALKPEEDIVAMTEGGAISLKSIGRTLRKTAKKARRVATNLYEDASPEVERMYNVVAPEVAKGAKVVKRGFNKTIVDSGVGKEIAKNLIRAGTDVILPGALGAASMALGDPTGMSGQVIGNVAGNYIKGAAEKGGYGLFKTLNKVGIKKKSVVKLGKKVGKVAVRLGAKAAGEAISAFTGNPLAGAAFEEIAVAGADKAIDSGSASKGFKTAGKRAATRAKMVAVEAVDDYIDKNLTGAEKRVAQKALAGKFPSASDLVYDDDGETGFSGMGMMLPRRTRGGLRMGMGMVFSGEARLRRAERQAERATPALLERMRQRELESGLPVRATPQEVRDLTRAVAATPNMASAVRISKTGNGMRTGFKVADDRMVTPATAPSSVIQLGSPFQRINSAAMSPFIAGSPQLVNRPISGGSFLPAGGRMGGSFVPAG